MTAWENIFALTVLFAQLAAIFCIGALVADKIVQPIIERRRRRKFING